MLHRMDPSRISPSLFMTPRGRDGRRLLPPTEKFMHGPAPWQPAAPDPVAPDVVRAGRIDQTFDADKRHPQRQMDQNGVPRSLQGQITPDRAAEIIDPPRRLSPVPPAGGQVDTAWSHTVVPPAPQRPQPAPAVRAPAQLSQSATQNIRTTKEANDHIAMPEKTWSDPTEIKLPGGISLKPRPTKNGFEIHGELKP